MVRLSLVNLYLHNFVNPQIYEYDTLTSEDRWNEYADVILANPPFMSPKGGIIPHKRFSVQSKRSEVLFVDYIAEHLTPSGRAAVIVPEGIIFQGAGAYKQLRKMLVEKYLYAVVSLPAGVFNPYSGVKTSILFLDRQIAAKTEDVLFVKVENDGYDLGAQRRAIEKNDLPEAAEVLREFRKQIGKETAKATTAKKGKGDTATNSLIVPKAKIAENGEYNLTGERYRVVERRGKQKWPMVRLGDVCGHIADTIDPHDNQGTVEYIGLENIEANSGKLIGDTLTQYDDIKSLKNIFAKDDILFGKLRPNLNKVYLAQFPGICSTDIYVLRAKGNILSALLNIFLRNDSFTHQVLNGVGGAQLPRVKFEYMIKLLIPLPPIEVQQEIVAEIEGYQKIIDGARQVVDNWKPQIEVDPEWPVVKLGEVCDVRDGTHDSPKYIQNGGYPLITSKNVKDDHIDFLDANYISKIDYDKINDRSFVDDGDIIMPMIGTIGNPVIVKKDREFAIKNVALIKFHQKSKAINQFVKELLNSAAFDEHYRKNSTGSTQKFISLGFIRNMEIPLPSLSAQQDIIEKVEFERKLVDGCRELITRYEERIKRVVDGVWGE
jgi:type I restriction enzyme M protein